MSADTGPVADTSAGTRQAEEVAEARLRDAWPVGSFAKHGGRMGKLTMRPDSDGDTKLEWADGSGTGDYIKFWELAKHKFTEHKFQQVRPQ